MNNEDPLNKPEEKKPASGIRVVGINLAVFIGYSLVSYFFTRQISAALFLMMIQIVACIVLALFYRKWSWILSALIILVIGFSTCVNAAHF